MSATREKILQFVKVMYPFRKQNDLYAYLYSPFYTILEKQVMLSFTQLFVVEAASEPMLCEHLRVAIQAS